MKLKYPHLPKTLGTRIQENYWSFYPSEPFKMLHFEMRYPVCSCPKVSPQRQPNNNNNRFDEAKKFVKLPVKICHSIMKLICRAHSIFGNFVFLSHQLRDFLYDVFRLFIFYYFSYFQNFCLAHLALQTEHIVQKISTSGSRKK